MPYHKPNNQTLYINKYSNHPPTILKQLLKIIDKRISEILSDIEEFSKVIPMYNQALKASGFKVKLTYNPNKMKRQTRKRNIT